MARKRPKWQQKARHIKRRNARMLEERIAEFNAANNELTVYVDESVRRAPEDAAITEQPASVVAGAGAAPHSARQAHG